MAKLTLNTIGSRYGSIDALNDNFNAIEAAIENTLSLDGTSPNAMEVDLDMNSQDILNVGEVSAETLRINGVLVEPTTGVTAGAAFQTYEYTATAGQTTFSVAPATPYNASIVVIVNGLQLSPTEVSVSGTNVLTPALTLGDEVVIRRYTAEPVAAPDATEINFIQVGTGAITRTSQDKIRESVSVEDFLPLSFVTTNDATTYIQAALNNGATVVDFLGIPLKCDAITVPAGVWAKNVSLTKYTNAAGNVVLVNTGCTVTGKIAGTGLVSSIQRCIYPAADGVTDVHLDVEVTAATVGVHAQYITTDTDANRPKRWTGYIYAHDIVGTTGASEGYGVLLSPANSCQLTINAKTIKRHALYLSAGTQDCSITLTVDGCNNYAAQLFSSSGQSATQRNQVTIYAKNLGEDVAGQGGAMAIVQKAHYNTITVHLEGNGITSEAVRVEGSGGGAPVPLANKITGGSITGQFIGGDVIKLLNADSTIIAGNRIDAYATASVIASRRTGTNVSTHGGYIYDNQINAQGQSIRGIYSEVNTVPTFIGINDIRNNGSGLRVDDQTGGLRQGFSRRVTFSGTTASIATLVTGDTTVTLADRVQTANRSADVRLTGASVQFFDKVFWSFVTSAPSETQLAFRTYNGHSAGQTFTYAGWVEGD